MSYIKIILVRKRNIKRIRKRINTANIGGWNCIKNKTSNDNDLNEIKLTMKGDDE